MNKIDISKPRESWENTVSHVSNINGTRKDIDAVLSDNRIILPKERYSSIDYIMTFPEGAKKKIFSSHIKFSSAGGIHLQYFYQKQNLS